MGIDRETLRIEIGLRGGIKAFAQGDQETPGEFKCFDYETTLRHFRRYASPKLRRSETTEAEGLWVDPITHKGIWYKSTYLHPDPSQRRIAALTGGVEVVSIWRKAR